MRGLVRLPFAAAVAVVVVAADVFWRPRRPERWARIARWQGGVVE